MLTSNGSRWTRHCVTTSATALFAVTGSVTAFASRQHIFQNGDTLSSIARTYHVSISDLEQANHLDRVETIRDGRRIMIPDPPKRLALEAAMHRHARAKGDRLSLRLGPGADYRRVNFVDDESSLTVTAEQDGWFQVELDNGRTGWLRQDFVAVGPHADHQGQLRAAHNAGRTQVQSRKAAVAHNAHKFAQHEMNIARAAAHDHAGNEKHSKATHKAHHLMGTPEEVARHSEPGEGRHHRAAAHAVGMHVVAVHAPHHNVPPCRRRDGAQSVAYGGISSYTRGPYRDRA